MFEDIKVGDRVALHLGWRKEIGEVKKVEADTFQADCWTIHKKDGSCYDYYICVVSAEKLTPEFEYEVIETKKKIKLVKAIKKFRVRPLSTQTLNQIVDLVNKDGEISLEQDTVESLSMVSKNKRGSQICFKI